LLEWAGSVAVVAVLAVVLVAAMLFVLASAVQAANRDVEEADETLAAVRVQQEAMGYLSALLTERGLSALALAEPGSDEQLEAAQQATDSSVEALRDAWNDERGSLDSDAFAAVLTDAGRLADLRSTIAAGGRDAANAIEQYRTLAEGVVTAWDDLTLTLEGTRTLANRRAVAALLQGMEDVAQQRLVLRRMVTGDATASPFELQVLERDISRDLQRFREAAPPDMVDAADEMVASEEWRSAERLADQIAAAAAAGSGDSGLTAEEWFEAGSARVDDVEALAEMLNQELVDAAQEAAQDARRDRVLRVAGLAALSGVAVVVAFGAVVAARQRQQALAEYATLAGGIASWFQQAALPELDDFEFEARYIPAASHARAGGDWYDVLTVDNGIVVLVGDVAGHGPQAAVEMTQVRNMLLGLATGADACIDIDALDDRLDGADVMATLAYVVIDTEDKTVRFCRNGHPPPLLRYPDGTVRILEEGSGPPIGVRLRSTREQGVCVLEPDTLLVLYTDGLIEEPGVNIDERIDRLVATVTENGTSLSDLAETLLEERGAEPQRDDIALLLVRYQPGGAQSDL
jgi:serine phosphatase RsbU (regulator of sigma subunit)